MKRVGKIGKANIDARKQIAVIAEQKGLDYCELGLLDCTNNWPLAPAHRHKRAWYKGDPNLLADYSQWVAACQNCHNRIENDQELTEEMFTKLRPII